MAEENSNRKFTPKNGSHARYEIDTSSIMDLKQEYQQKGLKNGVNHYPNVDANQDKDESELELKIREIANEVEDHKRKEIGESRKKLSAVITGWKHQLNSQSCHENLKNDFDRSKEKIENEFQKYKENLIIQKSEANKTSGELKKFKIDHSITRDCISPDSKLMRFAIIFGVVLLESSYNAYAHMGDQGLIHGAFFAMSISVTNIIIAFFLGRGFTYKNHLNQTYRYLGITSAFVALILAILINSFFATFRDELGKNLNAKKCERVISSSGVASSETTLAICNEDQASRMAFEASKSKFYKILYLQLPFSDLTGYLTFFITMIFSFIAFFDGYYWDDPIPGFGDVFRKQNKYKKIYENSWSLFEGEVEKIIREQLHNYENKLREIEKFKPSLLVAEKIKIETIKQDYQTDSQSINKHYQFIVENYRFANKGARADDHYPKFFDEAIKDFEFRENENFTNVINEYHSFITNDLRSYDKEYSKLHNCYHELKIMLDSFVGQVKVKFSDEIVAEAAKKSTRLRLDHED